MEWISLKVCPRSHFDGQGDVSQLPTRLAEAEAPVLPICPLRAHSRFLYMYPAALSEPLSPYLPITDRLIRPELREGSPAVTGGRWWELFFSTLSPMRDVILHSQRSSPFCPIPLRLCEKGSEQSKHQASFCQTLTGIMWDCLDLTPSNISLW